MSKTQSKLGVTIPNSTSSCCCWANLIYYYDYDQNGFKALTEECGEAALNWEFSNDGGSSWSNLDITTDPGFQPTGSPTGYFYGPYVLGAAGAGLYRLRINPSGCCSVYSNVIEAYIA